MKIKHRIFNILTVLVAFPLRLSLPFFNIIKRYIIFSCLKSKVWNINPTLQLDGKIDIIGTCNIDMDEYCRIGTSVQLETQANGKIELGKSIRINRGTTICSYANISIGNHCLIGEFVSIRDANHGLHKDKMISEQGHTSSPIIIGEDVWIGRGSCILSGVKIGNGAVIGANSVVTKDISPYSIAVGSPAHIIRNRE